MGAVGRLVSLVAGRTRRALDDGAGVRVASAGGGCGATRRAGLGAAAGAAGRLLDRRGDPGPAGRGRRHDRRGRLGDRPVRRPDPGRVWLTGRLGQLRGGAAGDPLGWQCAVRTGRRARSGAVQAVPGRPGSRAARHGAAVPLDAVPRRRRAWAGPHGPASRRGEPSKTLRRELTTGRTVPPVAAKFRPALEGTPTAARLAYRG